MERFKDWIKRIVNVANTTNVTVEGVEQLSAALNKLNETLSNIVTQIQRIESEVNELRRRIEELERPAREKTVLDSLYIAEDEIRRLREFMEALCRELRYRGWGHVCR